MLINKGVQQMLTYTKALSILIHVMKLKTTVITLSTQATS